MPDLKETFFVDPNRPGRLINRVSRMTTRWADAGLAPMGLSAAQIPVFGALKDGGARTQKELATLAQIEQPTMAALLARMERDGLVRRTPDPADGRSSLISLTSLARKKLPAAAAMMSAGGDLMLRGFSDREVATLVRLLRKMVNNLENESSQ